MRALVVITVVLLAGCTAPQGPDPSSTTTAPVTCPDTSTSGVPAECLVGGCFAFLSFQFDYAAAGNDNTSQVRAHWSYRGLGIADLQDESDHEHIVATGQGEYNMSSDDGGRFRQTYEDAVRLEHVVLSWFAETSEAVEQTFCEALDDTQGDVRPGDGPWLFVTHGGYDPTYYSTTPDGPLGQAFCAAWNETKEETLPRPLVGGHHGNLCPETSSPQD